MSGKINGYGPTALPFDPGMRRNGATKSAVDATAPAAPVSTGSDVATLQSAPRVATARAADTERVAQVRAAIESGTYRIDPEAIAARLVDLEKQLP